MKIRFFITCIMLRFHIWELCGWGATKKPQHWVKHKTADLLHAIRACTKSMILKKNLVITIYTTKIKEPVWRWVWVCVGVWMCLSASVCGVCRGVGVGVGGCVCACGGVRFVILWGLRLKLGMGGRGWANGVQEHIFEMIPPKVKGHLQV